MPKMPVILQAGIWALACGVSGFCRADETAGAAWADLRAETFDVVWRTVNDSYHDPTFGGLDWPAVGERYRARLSGVEDKAALRALLQTMLGELRQTHFAILPREMAVFTPEERSRAGTLGLTVTWAAGELAIEEVAPGSPGAAAGLTAGEVLRGIDEIEFADLGPWLDRLEISPARRVLYLTGLAASRLRGPVGKTVHLRLGAAPAEVRQLELPFADHPGEWSEPMGDLPSVPIQVLRRCEPDGLAYLRFNVFARAVMKDFRALLRQLPADGGLVLDLRGNPGGLTVMASGLSGWLSDRVFPLGTMQLRAGHIGYTVHPQPGAFLGPVAVLIDGSSASTSEILAAGLQEAGRVRVFGEPSPGAALPSLFKALPTGDLLQHAVADLQTPGGVLIEGRGVTPDEIVPRTAADLAAGRDPVVEAARRWLETERRKAPPAPAAAP